MSVNSQELALNSEIDKFWQGSDRRQSQPLGVDEAHTDTPMFVWGIMGTPLALPQPHYRIFLPAPYYVVGWGLLADVAGNAIIAVEHATYSPGVPAVFTDVTGGNRPTLLGQQGVVTRKLTTWTPQHWGFFDMLHVYILSTVGLQELTFQLFTRRQPRVGGRGSVTAVVGDLIVTSTGVPVTLAQP